MKKEYAKLLLEKIRDDYNKIAQHFDLTRSYLPGDIKSLAEYINTDDKVLDIGCGNGRVSALIERNNYWGTDVSEKMIAAAQKKYSDKRFVVSDFLRLPFENNFFDKAICLAVLHHIPSKKLRIEFLKELRRVLKPNAMLLLTVWDLNKGKKSRKLFLKYTLLKLIGKSKLDFKDVLRPWKNSKGQTIIERYIHVFSLRELKNLIKDAGFSIIETSEIKRSEKGRNLFIIAKA